MKRGFYTIMAAQFCSSLADNALFIACIAILTTMHAPAWMAPFLKWSFSLFYVLLAAFVGAFADAYPKGKVMFATNIIKIFGCSLIFLDVHPAIAYGIVGMGAAAYSPAKYGILTELLPPEQLVAANGWIEGLTIASIVLGVVLGGQLVGNPAWYNYLLSFDMPGIDTGIDTPAAAALAVITGIYLLAALFNLRIPATGAVYAKQYHTPGKLIEDFAHCCSTLWRDKLGQISLAVTTLFWGCGMALQYIVLRWGQEQLGLTLAKATVLQGVFSIGLAVGAVTAAKFVSLRRSLSVVWVGIAMGLIVMVMTLVHQIWLAYPLLILIGALAGYFVVPMNALLQHRGHVLMSAGHSIAVQNFNENLSVLTVLAFYALLLRLEVGLGITICLFGGLVALVMYLVIRRHQANQREFDNEALIGIDPKAPH
ncbi:lysophospholipid transporter LplT [Massilia sp. TS11]|uniref:lysophospholipid transporter LplT n=1 Tax=Massilia sp. TS11 TaxID=2908003 RepID=UPI001EDC82E2|nr:lysophospholipid transporter LplT [Massilia sp. TS11]MCG2585769.1 lysophospholipid transporter LplT [Massilia sp. TS11]